jgi:hypothetical protein
MENCQEDTNKGKQKPSRKARLSVTFFTTNFRRNDTGLKSKRCGLETKIIMN